MTFTWMALIATPRSSISVWRDVDLITSPVLADGFSRPSASSSTAKHLSLLLFAFAYLADSDTVSSDIVIRC